MQRQKTSLLLLMSTVLAVQGTNTAIAQKQSRPADNRSVRITQMVSPTFKVSPLVHSLEGRRGEVIPFTFVVESLGRSARVRVRPVALTQRETGVILPTAGGLADDIITLDSPETFQLEASEDLVIKGELRVPLTDSSFFSCGLLVTDLGMNDLGNAPRPAGEPRVQVKFMTQYLCRCDVRVPGGRLADVGAVKLEPIRIVPHRGWPMVQVYAHNPTDNAFELELRCRFGTAADVKRSRSFGLTMPVRSNLEGKQRFSARILPGATVRLESVVPRSVSDGDYILQTELIANRRTIKRFNVPVSVHDSRFPAQQIQIAELPSGLAFEPTQIELSMAEDGSRRQSIHITNPSKQATTVLLRATDEHGESIKTVSVRPNRVKLTPNGSRRVSVTALPTAYRGGTTLCRVEAIVEGTNDQANWPVTIAVVGKQSGIPNVTYGTMRLDTSRTGHYVVVPLTNSGGVHLPVSGQIIVTAENGMRYELLAGFGKWLLPGKQTELRFRLPTELEDGRYQMTTDIEYGTRLAAMQRTDPIEFPIRLAADPKQPTKR